MKCPVCKDVTLLMSEKNGVEIDYCPECRGIWLDRGELDKIVDRARGARESYREEERYHSETRRDDRALTTTATAGTTRSTTRSTRKRRAPCPPSATSWRSSAGNKRASKGSLNPRRHFRRGFRLP